MLVRREKGTTSWCLVLHDMIEVMHLIVFDQVHILLFAIGCCFLLVKRS